MHDFKKVFKFVPLLGLTLAIHASQLNAAAPTPAPATASATEAYRPHMQAVYVSLTRILNFALRDKETIDSKTAAAVEADLKNVAEQSKAIRLLSREKDPGHQFLAKELEQSAETAFTKFKAGSTEQAKSFVSDVVYACFGCHTSRAAPADSRFTLAFDKDLGLDRLDPLARARFLALSRRFDSAITAFESIFSKQKMNLDEVLNYDPMVEYLVHTLRVRPDPKRALKTLETYKNTGLPKTIAQDIDQWIAALKERMAHSKQTESLAEAQALLKQTGTGREDWGARRNMVHYILASRILNNVLAETKLAAADRANAYYLLGECELALGTQLFPDESSAYFEETIRLMPRSELAQKALRRYEENLTYLYSGSSGSKIPEDERLKLDALKKIAF